MVGADPKFQIHHRANRVISPATQRDAQPRHAHPRRWHWIAAASLFVPLSFVLVQCGKAPSADMLAANAHAATGDSFEDRFPQPQFADRFPTPSESLVQQVALAPAPSQRKVRTEPVRVASLNSTLTLPRQSEREELTTLVSMKSSAFPYFGTNPRSEAPFLNITKGDRKGHRSYGGRVYWQDETYNDSRVLVHVPETFDVRKPGVIVVFFHGNGATLERDVRDRQLVPQQISDSGVNAVLLAPQLAVNAADSSAGKFWQPGGFKRFMDESATHLARLTGDPKSAQAFANMPIVIVGYSGGFLPTAWSLDVGGATNRVRGVFLLDAVYGELDKFASWIEKNRTGFFVSSYTRYTKRRDQELIGMLRDKGITVTENMDGPLRPGSVVFVQTRDGITHRNYVTQAWTEHPVKDVLVKMAASPQLTRIASAPSPANR
ncbi:alpha/beta hydrolase [Bradyrhizobium sp. AUGA SZCCT0240]|uniref:alpha/beta hydrolase n=1 Tax=unclassified Bradyrhizobium TaxID=2631580 RepID=UPI001BA60F16|nr:MULTISPECIES: alpha/beta hydrolase [unclassified Bradyrhizobium]MBR1198329.1 alpha/beta hydrolase [Bradyrhizobium sp. AUGA SZCCT0158]MBR1238974.1 alpha/beta hydrolase [Bradyrhizobium sp. AUGA SZCCT0274]MBR1255787.1 alpha/beta hydrolase [Bradyrhizobium sp. AUGA SZCCT0240]